MAHKLVEALLEGVDPKRFLHRMRRAQAQPTAYVPPPVRTQDCHEWEDWEDLEAWQRIAAVEMQQAEDMEFKLGDYDLRHMDLITRNFEFVVYEDIDAAQQAARECVEADLDDDPSNFEQSWLERFINTDRLKDLLHSDVKDSNRSMYDDEWRDYETKRDELIERTDLNSDDFYDEDGNALEITPDLESKIDSAYEDFLEEITDSQLEDPMSYMRDMYGRQDAPKEAIRIAGLNSYAAAENAVNADGWAHFLAHYDHESRELPSGAVYGRVN